MTRGIYLLGEQHVARLQELASDPRLAATTRLPQPYPPDGARDFVGRMQRARDTGDACAFAIEDRQQLVGVVRLQRHADDAELSFWVGVPHQGLGHATFAVQTVLPFAFDNLRLACVWAEALANNTAALRVLTKCGFAATGERAHGEPGWPADARLHRFALTAAEFRARRDVPALTMLHPTLRALLAAELAAGNEIQETGHGWPDAGSAFVRLRHPFRALPAQLPDGVTHTVVNDPHWWQAEVATRAPRQWLSY